MALQDELAALEDMSSSALRETWQRLTGEIAPRVSPKLLRLALAYELQAKELGGLSRTAQQKLDQLAAGKTQTAAARPSTRLIREWQGKAHVVTIGEDNVIRWGDREFRSLSQVAKAITGTHWSGPAFFGLKKRIAA